MSRALVPLLLCLIAAAPAAPPKEKPPTLADLRDAVAALQKEVAELRAQVQELQSRLSNPRASTAQAAPAKPGEIKVGMKVADAEKAMAAKGYTYERKRFEDANGTAEIWYVKDGPYSRIQINDGAVSSVGRRD